MRSPQALLIFLDAMLVLRLITCHYVQYVTLRLDRLRSVISLPRCPKDWWSIPLINQLMHNINHQSLFCCTAIIIVM